MEIEKTFFLNSEVEKFVQIKKMETKITHNQFFLRLKITSLDETKNGASTHNMEIYSP